MKKKHIWIWTSIAVLGVFAFSVSLSFDQKLTYIKPKDESKKFSVNVQGAVRFPNVYTFDKPMKIIEVLKGAQPLSDADLSNIGLSDEISKNTKIYVPHKIHESHLATNETLYWSSFHQIDQLTRLGISKTVAVKLLKHKKTKGVISWEQIEKMKIGLKNLQKLKQVLIL